uniref:Transmembrane protein 163a n=1 Tax=Xiphophorus couchianus TaxID=32473 RepID=A0A3B5M750_9TELE
MTFLNTHEEKQKRPCNILCVCFLFAGLLESSMRLKPQEAQNYRKKALWVSWVSIVVTLILAVAAFSKVSKCESCLALGLLISLWRLRSDIVIRQRFKINRNKFSKPFIVVKCFSLYKFHDDFLYSVSIVSGLSCAVLAVAKFMLGKKLTSRALITDGFNSLVGAIMGFSILISAEVFKQHPDVWFLDGTIGVLIGLIILAYGVKLLKDMVPRVRQTRNYERFE